MSLSALWDVTNQFNTKNGSILVGGKIYIYYQGRTALATTYHDEDGTVVNSNPVLLDNNGRATVFADPIYSYTIVVCDYYGKELFSQDISLHDAISTAEDVVVIGSDGTVQVDTTQLPNGVQYDLSVNTDIIATKEDVSDLEVEMNDKLADKKDKQSELVYGGNTHMTITRIKQNENGNITEVKYEPIDLPPEVPNVEITSPNGTIDVQSSTDVQTNTKTFEIDIKNGDPVWHYWTGNNAWTQVNTSSWTQINRPAIGAGSNPHAWNPDIKRGIYDVKAHFTVTFHNYENSKTVPNQIIQVGFRAKFVGKNDPTSINYVDLGSWTYDPSLYTTESYQYNFAQESLRQNHDTSKIINVANYWGDTDFDVYFEAALLNTDGSQDVPPIDTVLFAEITYFGYHEVKGTVQSTGGGGPEYTAGAGIEIDDSTDTISVDAGAGLTFNEGKLTVDFDEVNEHQVQSDWTESDTTDPAFIQNKPTEKSLIAGQNVTITDTANGVRIDAAGGTFTQVQSNWNESDTSSPAYIQNKPNMSDYATDTELSNAVDALEQQIQNIPAQEQANWTESDTTDPSYIKNKPSTTPLVAGQNVTITDQGSSVVISATSGSTYTAGTGIDITNDVISANLEAGDGITIVPNNGKAKIINSDNANALPIIAGNGISLEYANDQLTISSNSETRTLLYSGNASDARSGTFTLSQSAYNFDRIELTCIDINNYVIKQVADMPDASLVGSNGTRGSWFNSVTSGTQTWFKAMNWKVNQAGTTLTYTVDEIATSGNNVTAINRDQTGNRPIMLRIYGYKTNYGA